MSGVCILKSVIFQDYMRENAKYCGTSTAEELTEET